MNILITRKRISSFATKKILLKRNRLQLYYSLQVGAVRKGRCKDHALLHEALQTWAMCNSYETQQLKSTVTHTKSTVTVTVTHIHKHVA